MTTAPNKDELRLLVRRALLDMLEQQARTPSDIPDFEDQSPPRFPASQRAVTVTLRGSERSVGLLEEALADGDTDLEIALGTHWGPKVRVRAEPSAVESGSVGQSTRERS